MKLPIAKHIEFFDKQLLFMEQEWQRYTSSKVLSLWKDRKLFIGRIWGFDKKRGQLIVRFKKGNLPRLKVPYQICLISSTAGSNHMNWDFTYDNFRQNHSIKSSRIEPIYHLKPQDEWRFLGCNQVTHEFMHEIEDSLLSKEHPLILFAQEDPPYKYLQNLKLFVSQNPSNLAINLDTKKTLEEWNPFKLPVHEKLTKHVLQLLESNKTTIIQGPPGTGKTHLVSEICKSYSEQGKSICVTATTNKTLIEIASKDALKEIVKVGRVLKTNLSYDEEKKVVGIKHIDETVAIPGNIIFSTYYLLSNEFKEFESKKNKFDLIVIEEASQAFLAAIAGFIELANKVLIVGDPMQLYPIISNPRECNKIHPSVKKAIRGLETFTVNHEEISHRITQTFRLSNKAASQTGIFYGNELLSVSPLNDEKLFKTKYADMFCEQCGASIVKMDMLEIENGAGIPLATKMAIDIKKNNPNFSIAILSNLKKTVEEIYDSVLMNYHKVNDFEIETIDRIQGLTTDVTILLFESSIQFGLELNRFNVATSRAKRGTIIITGNQIEMLQGVNPLVKNYLSNAKNIEI